MTKMLVGLVEKLDKRIDDLRVLIGAEVELGTYDDTELAVLRERFVTLESVRATMAKVDLDELHDGYVSKNVLLSVTTGYADGTPPTTKVDVAWKQPFSTHLLAHIKEGK